MRKTKIICTLGPASRDEKTIKALLKNGMNVARINMSHNELPYHEETITRFRKIRDELKVPAAIMMDTRGPEIRIKKFTNESVTIKEGDTFTLTTKDVAGDENIVSITYPNLPKELSKGTSVLIDDGRIELEVTECTKTDIVCKVIYGGEISGNKGINIPHVSLNLEYLSERDKEDLLFGISQDVDFIAASFVRSKDDVVALRRFLNYHGAHDIRIISKIESIEAVDNFDEILNHSDGIMIARGDMGVEVEFEKLPGLQKRFIKSCYQSGKMVITATQMLESMIKNTSPTRAEITDVANAIFDGTSAIMLSGETAVGDNPVLVVKVMSKIARQAEQDAFAMKMYEDFDYLTDYSDNTNAICDAAKTTANDLNAKAIIVVTKSGRSARRMSKFRPKIPIVASTPVTKTYHQLSLSWGVYPTLSLYQKTSEDLFLHAIDCAEELNIVKQGDCVVITAGLPLATTGNTNMLKVEIVGGIEN